MNTFNNIPLPNGWEVKRVKDVAELNPNQPKCALYNDDMVSFIPMECLRNGYIEKREAEYNEVKSYTPFINNDILVAKVTPCFENGNIAIATELTNKIGFGSSEIFVIRCKTNTNNKYVFYTTTSLFFKNICCQSMKGVGGLKRISPVDLVSATIPLPPLPVQTQIAAYLDEKTAQIDSRIALLNAKADKYRTLRRSIINQAVTQGLEPNPVLKPSGIKWIENIPQGWEVKRVKEIFVYDKGGTPESKIETYYEGNNIWVNISDLTDSKYIYNAVGRLSNDAISICNIPLVKKGSLLYSFKLSIGKMAFMGVDGYTNEAIIAICPNKKVDLNFWYYALDYYLQFAATENIYGAKMLNQKLIANAIVFFPPLPVQTRIAAYLDEKTAQIDTIVSNIQKQVEQLNTLRRSIIDQAVTGQISEIIE